MKSKVHKKEVALFENYFIYFKNVNRVKVLHLFRHFLILKFSKNCVTHGSFFYAKSLAVV